MWVLIRTDNPSMSSESIYLANFDRLRTDKSSVKVAAEYKIIPLSSPQFKTCAETELGDRRALTKTLVSRTK